MLFDFLNIFEWEFLFFLPSLNFSEAAPEAVKRKAVEETDAADAADETTAPTPEKKSKVEEAAHENGAAEEVVA